MESEYAGVYGQVTWNRQYDQQRQTKLMPPTTNSDSEDDLDYVPPADYGKLRHTLVVAPKRHAEYSYTDHDLDSSNEQDDVGHNAETALPEMVPTERKKQRDALWASFQASVSTPPSSSEHGEISSQPAVVKQVKIEKTYLFAGKHVTDVVEVPEDSEEAKKWPRWLPHPRPTSESVPAPTSSSEKGQGEDKGKSDIPAPPPAVDPSPVSTTIATSTPGLKRPGPRKPRNALPSIPRAPQAKKITTLDKSAMDWHAHVGSQSSDVKHELDANRRGGGYLEKVEFLKRVEDRREDVREASKSSKRRKT
ncbi:bucentaur or craniofacial development-domain-containing protein [Butyriboletus roseoflavus]|nr:bucentaur or craniofacial development-domain-containing protein [Butyriboletus roseoflavus]